MNKTVVIGIIGAVFVALALGLNLYLNHPEPPPETQATSQKDAGQNAAGDAGGEEQASADGQSAEQASKDAGGETNPAVEARAPSFDVVRVSPNGDVVIAGRAEPGSTVVVLDGEKEIGSVIADKNGEWVLLPSQPLAPGDHKLSVKSTLADGKVLESENYVVLVVPEAGKDIAGNPASDKSEPLALLVPKDGSGPTRVLQKPSVPGSVESETGDLAVDNVDYDADGNVTVSGRGLPGGEIRIYLNNDFVGRTEIADNGLWRLTPEKIVDPGVYQMRIDMLNGDKVVSRLELPFSRAEPLKDFHGEAFVVVQPGNSLWRIARRTLGSGFSYTVIYQANKDQIRDPDLIYPGQIFEVPKD